MTTFFCHKLGRDRIVELCEQEKIEIDWHIMNDEAYQQALTKKIEEEAQEVITASQEELLEEIADVQEVIDCLLKVHGFTKEQLREAQAEKRERKGGFDEKIYITSFTVADDSPWKEHFLKQPTKYPIKK